MARSSLLENPDVSLSDIEAELERLRKAVSENPEKYGDLKPLIANFPEKPGESIDLDATVAISQAATNRARRRTKTYKTLEARQALFEANAKEALKRYYAGDLNINELGSLLRSELKGLRISAAVAGKGNKWDAMTFRDWGYVGNDLRREYGFLDAKILNILEERKSPAQFADDLRKFAEAANQSYERTAVSRTGLPYDVLPTMPGAGDTDCYTGCKCWWEIRTRNAERGNFDIYWRLGQAEHCATCRKRASNFPEGWAGVRVRGGKLQDNFPPIYRNK